MQATEIEESIIHWANRYLETENYTRYEQLLDAEFFFAILSNYNIKEDNKNDAFQLSMGALDSTLSILKEFYREIPNISEHPDYRNIISDEIICTESHVLPITELIIGVLLK
jgi:hypothetical protein